MARLQKHYREKVAPALIEKFGYKSPMQVLRSRLLVCHVGVTHRLNQYGCGCR